MYESRDGNPQYQSPDLDLEEWQARAAEFTARRNEQAAAYANYCADEVARVDAEYAAWRAEMDERADDQPALLKGE